MVDDATLARWIADLGDGALRLDGAGSGIWTVSAQRELSAEQVTLWGAGPDDLAGAVAAIASGFPLVDAEVAGDQPRRLVRFSAKLYGEGLSRQAFLLTASSVVKAAGAVDVLTATYDQYAAAIKSVQRSDAGRQAPPPRRAASVPVVGACPGCGNQNQANSKFCRKCGTRL